MCLLISNPSSRQQGLTWSPSGRRRPDGLEVRPCYQEDDITMITLHRIVIVIVWSHMM